MYKYCVTLNKVSKCLQDNFRHPGTNPPVCWVQSYICDLCDFWLWSHSPASACNLARPCQCDQWTAWLHIYLVINWHCHTGRYLLNERNRYPWCSCKNSQWCSLGCCSSGSWTRWREEFSRSSASTWKHGGLLRPSNLTEFYEQHPDLKLESKEWLFCA